MSNRIASPPSHQFFRSAIALSSTSAIANTPVGDAVVNLVMMLFMLVLPEKAEADTRVVMTWAIAILGGAALNAWGSSVRDKAPGDPSTMAPGGVTPNAIAKTLFGIAFALIVFSAPASATDRPCSNQAPAPCFEHFWQFYPCELTSKRWSPFGPERVRVCVHDFDTGEEWAWTRGRPRVQAEAEIDQLYAQVCPAWRPDPERFPG